MKRKLYWIGIVACVELRSVEGRENGSVGDGACCLSMQRSFRMKVEDGRGNSRQAILPTEVSPCVLAVLFSCCEKVPHPFVNSLFVLRRL